MTQETKRSAGAKPAFIAYFVPDRDKAPWTRIGAAWQHEDKQGLSLRLDLMPAAEGRIFLRMPQEQDDTASAAPSA